MIGTGSVAKARSVKMLQAVAKFSPYITLSGRLINVLVFNKAKALCVSWGIQCAPRSLSQKPASGLQTRNHSIQEIRE